MRKLLFISVVSLYLLGCKDSETATPIKVAESEVISYVAKTSLAKDISVEKVDFSRQQGLDISYVTYKADGKMFNNIAFIKGKGKFEAGGKLYQVNNEGGGGGYVVKCSGTCDGSNTACAMKGEYNPNTGTNTIECTCEGCKMSVNQQ